MLGLSVNESVVELLVDGPGMLDPSTSGSLCELLVLVVDDQDGIIMVSFLAAIPYITSLKQKWT